MSVILPKRPYLFSITCYTLLLGFVIIVGVRGAELFGAAARYCQPALTLGLLLFWLGMAECFILWIWGWSLLRTADQYSGMTPVLFWLAMIFLIPFGALLSWRYLSSRAQPGIHPDGPTSGGSAA
ncbi:hypothetical protein [Nevskia soli]|uniref:hypothetical protein n=1 Tax=Nevskia soli TaxID=418856 RepID=UPI0004A75580|nr:hypothetical protein [Nevskia soli]